MKTLFRMLGAGLVAVVHLLALLLKIVYNILRFFRIRILAFYLIVCGAVQLIFRTFSGFGAAYFWIGFALCFLVTLFGWIRIFREKFRRRDLDEQAKRANGEMNEVPVPQQEELTAAFPRYFEVEGHAGYLFAEYEDRYELFRRYDGGWDYIRTDYKEEVR